MHCGWVCNVIALSLLALQGLVLPAADASLKQLDAGDWDALLKVTPTPTTLVLLYDESAESGKTEQILEDMVSHGDISQLMPGAQVLKQKKGDVLSTMHQITSYPALVLIKPDSTAFCTDKLQDSDAIFFWLEKAGPTSLTRTLDDSSFEHLTQASTGSTTGHWAVLFYRDRCRDHFTVLESLGVSEKLWLNVAKVNLDSSPLLEKRFKVTACPELIYFREGKMYRYETAKYDLPSLVSFVKSWFRNVKGSVVPGQPTSFDALTEGIAMYLKDQLEGENRFFTLAVIGGFVVTVMLTSIFCCLTGGSDSKQKSE